MAWNEVVERRSSHSKTFQDSENPTRYRLQVSQKALHYNNNGNWLETTDRIVPTGNATRPHGINEVFSFEAPANSMGNFRFQYGNSYAIWILKNAVSSPAVVGENSIRYNNAWTNADVEYISQGEFLRKYIHLRTGHANEFTFRLQEESGFNGRNWQDFVVLDPVLENPITGDTVDATFTWRRVQGRMEGTITLPAGNWNGWILDPTFNTTLGSGADDGNYSHTDSSYSNSGFNIYLGQNGPVQYNSWYRFTGFTTIPAGSTFNSGTPGTSGNYIKWASLADSSVDVRVTAIDQADATAPTDYSDAASRPLTTAYTDWTTTTATTLYSPDLSTILQEVMDTHGAMSSFVIHIGYVSGSVSKRVRSYEQKPDNTVVYIDYTEDAGGSPQTLEADVVTSSPTIGTSTLEAGDSSISADVVQTNPSIQTASFESSGTDIVSASVVDSSPTINTATIAAGSQDISTSVVATTPSIQTATFASGSSSIESTTVTTSPTINTPTVVAGNVDISASVVESTPAINTATFESGTDAIEAAVVETTPVINTASIEAGSVAIEASVVGVSPTVNDGEFIDEGATLIAGAVSTSPTINSVTTIAGSVTIETTATSILLGMYEASFVSEAESILADSVVTNPEIPVAEFGAGSSVINASVMALEASVQPVTVITGGSVLESSATALQAVVGLHEFIVPPSSISVDVVPLVPTILTPTILAGNSTITAEVLELSETIPSVFMLGAEIVDVVDAYLSVKQFKNQVLFQREENVANFRRSRNTANHNKQRNILNGRLHD